MCIRDSRGGVRFQKLAVIKVKRILHIARRVIFGDVKRLKAVIIVDDLKIILDNKAHRGENLFQLAPYQGDRMVRAMRQVGRQGDICLLYTSRCV